MRFFLYGLFFSITTVFFWGLIPIALKVSGGFSDPITLTWLRFFVAGIIVFLWQWAWGRLHEFRKLNRREWVKLLVAGLFLMINYTCFTWSLDYLRPEAAQLGMQMAPLFLALGGLIFLNERVVILQWGCFAGILVGLGFFFHPLITGDTSSMVTGFLIILTSAFCWSSYAIVQKTLFKKLDASNILLAIYLMATVVMLPASHPTQLLNMDLSQTLIALFCCLNTVVAYGAFAQSLKYWDTVQVSAVIALTPVFSYILTELCIYWQLWSDIITPSHADRLSLFGMVVVIISAISIQVVSVMVKRRNRIREQVSTAAQS